MPHPPCSPDISLCDFWLFRRVKQIMKDGEFSLREENEDAIAQVWNDLIFDDLQRVFYD
jgi:hypothetical protein